MNGLKVKTEALKKVRARVEAAQRARSVAIGWPPKREPIRDLAEAKNNLFKVPGLRELDAELERWGFKAEDYDPACCGMVAYYTEGAKVELYEGGYLWALWCGEFEIAPELRWAEYTSEGFVEKGETVQELRAMLEELFEKAA
jgi:hypothetical protein